MESPSARMPEDAMGVAQKTAAVKVPAMMAAKKPAVLLRVAKGGEGSGGVLEPRMDSGDLLPLLGDEGASPSDWMTKRVRMETEKGRFGHTKRRY